MPGMQSNKGRLSPKLFILSSVFTAWQKESSRFRFRETGGMLIGYWTRSGNAVITHATKPGPKAIHGYKYFVADCEYCQVILDDIIDRTGGEFSYIGDWHTHPVGLIGLSQQDMITAKSVSMDPSYLCPRPLVAVYRPKHEIFGLKLSAKLGVWYYNHDNSLYISMSGVQIECIPGHLVPNLVEEFSAY